jgi:hypothetical protein
MKLPPGTITLVSERDTRQAKKQVVTEMLLQLNAMLNALSLLYKALDREDETAAQYALVELAKAEAEFDELGMRLTKKQ